MKLTNNIDKFGAVGLFLTALFSPCCFPLFAFAASALGFGGFELFGGWTKWIFQIMLLIAVLGLYLSYQNHRFIYPLLIAIISALLVFYGYHGDKNNQPFFLYMGMFGIFVSTIWNYKQNKTYRSCSTCTTYNGKKVELQSTICCPSCGHKNNELMPTNACEFFYECANCKKVLKPKQGDCCVYCSYGTVKCPPIQAGNACC